MVMAIAVYGQVLSMSKDCGSPGTLHVPHLLASRRKQYHLDHDDSSLHEDSVWFKQYAYDFGVHGFRFKLSRSVSDECERSM